MSRKFSKVSNMKSVSLKIVLWFVCCAGLSAQNELPFYFAMEKVKFDEEFHDGLVSFYKDGLYGAVNTKGEVVIAPRFRYSFHFQEGVAFVKDPESGLHGLINKKGEYICNPQFKYESNFHNGIAQVIIKDKCGLINLEGKLLVEYELDFPSAGVRYPIDVRIYGKYGLIDYNGFVLNAEYDHMTVNEDYPVIGLKKNDANLYYHLDKKAFVEGYDANSELYITTVKNGKSYLHGLLDENGHEVCQPVYSNIERFYDGIAYAWDTDRKCCFINTKGEILFRENDEWRIKGGFSEGVAPYLLKQVLQQQVRTLPQGLPYMQRVGIQKFLT
jgi:hypothetical protein